MIRAVFVQSWDDVAHSVQIVMNQVYFFLLQGHQSRDDDIIPLICFDCGIGEYKVREISKESIVMGKVAEVVEVLWVCSLQI